MVIRQDKYFNFRLTTYNQNDKNASDERGVCGEEVNRFVIFPFRLNPEKENHKAIMKQHRLILLEN